MSETLDPLIEALQGVRGKTRSPFRLGTVTGTTGGVQVQFDGESATSPKAYKRLGSYTPTVGNRVILARVGSTWVVMGAVV